jgi:CubicO group peptidase (beta-lactamase class C family)
LGIHRDVRPGLCLAVFSIFLVMPAGRIDAQQLVGLRLTDYIGTYSDAPGHTLEIVDGDGLFAVLDEAKYSLRSSGVDQFSPMAGPAILFQRDANGEVTGYEQDGTFHPRITTSVTPEAAALAWPRPLGQNSPADYNYQAPADMHDGIAVGDIAHSDLGVGVADELVHSILDGTYKDVHSVLLYQRGKLVLEEYFYGYSVGRQHQLRSATKSVVSALAGIAIDHGAIKGADQPVLPLMSYASYDHPDSRKVTITLGDFLSMSSGLDCNDHSSMSPGRETEIDDKADWVKATLDLPMIGDPGTAGFYCSGGVAVAGRMVENAVHMKLSEFAQANLFGPLGIARTDWTWNYDLTNADTEYSQIHLRPRDMLKLGILFGDGGLWHGRRIISESWVHTSLAEHSHVANVSYGYFWWRHAFDVKTADGAQQIVVAAAQGNGGQKIFVLPQYDLVAIFTAGGYNADSTPPNTIMEKIILPRLMKVAGHRKAASVPK